MKIFKYPLAITGEQVIQMPRRFKPLTVQNQHDQTVMWAMVDTDAAARDVRVRVIGTGNPMPDMDGFKYAGTVQTLAGMLVWHVFVEVMD